MQYDRYKKAKARFVPSVGTAAEVDEVKEFFEKKVRLETRVKVSSSWRQDEQALRQFGYLD